jgi:hypothetical protein
MKSTNVLGQYVGVDTAHFLYVPSSSGQRDVKKDSHVGAVMLRRNIMSKATVFIRI